MIARIQTIRYLFLEHDSFWKYIFSGYYYPLTHVSTGSLTAKRMHVISIGNLMASSSKCSVWWEMANWLFFNMTVWKLYNLWCIRIIALSNWTLFFHYNMWTLIQQKRGELCTFILLGCSKVTVECCLSWRTVAWLSIWAMERNGLAREGPIHRF